MTPDIRTRLKAIRAPFVVDCWDLTNDAGNPADEHSVIDPPEEPTACRLAACWNALLGIPTEVIESGAIRDVLDLLQEAVNAESSRGFLRLHADFVEVANRLGIAETAE